MVSCPRSELVREGEIATYHVWSRCVQQLMLCGLDYLTGRDFSYRRAWLELLLEYLAGVFAVEVGNFNILSNHIHAILRTRPDIVKTLSDEEVAWRWKRAWPRWEKGEWIREPTDREIAELLADPEKIEAARKGLSSLSWFMARWKEPVARLANEEANTKGHFWDGRYGCREVLDDAGLLTCMLYVDTNQVQAGMATSLESSQHSGIALRLAQWHQEAANGTVQGYCSENWHDHELELIELERLFSNCWLTPISAAGPLKTDETRIASDIQPQASDDRKDESGDACVEAGDAEQSDDPPVETEPAAEALGGDVAGVDARAAGKGAEPELAAATGKSLQAVAEPGEVIPAEPLVVVPTAELPSGVHAVLARGEPIALEQPRRERATAVERTVHGSRPQVNRAMTHNGDLASAPAPDDSRLAEHGGSGLQDQHPAERRGSVLQNGPPELQPVAVGDDCQPAEEPPVSRPDRLIHQRLMARCTRRRASDNPILAMPFAQYLRIARWVVDNVTSNVRSQTADVPSSASDEAPPGNEPPANDVPPWLNQLARQLGLNPDGWIESLRQFESWFGRAIGAAPALQALLERTGKRRIQGFRNCQAAFG